MTQLAKRSLIDTGEFDYSVVNTNIRIRRDAKNDWAVFLPIIDGGEEYRIDRCMTLGDATSRAQEYIDAKLAP